jgi:hypothetical protein
MFIVSSGMARGYLLWLKEKATFGPPFLSGKGQNDFATINLCATAAATSSYLFYFA